jgi:hypothetical protein
MAAKPSSPPPPPSSPPPLEEQQPPHLEVQPVPPAPPPRDVGAISFTGSAVGAVICGALAAFLFSSLAAVPAGALAGGLIGGFVAGATAAERSEAGPVARVVHDSVAEVEKDVLDAAPPLPHVIEEKVAGEEQGTALAAALAAPPQRSKAE